MSRTIPLLVVLWMAGSILLNGQASNESLQLLVTVTGTQYCYVDTATFAESLSFQSSFKNQTNHVFRALTNSDTATGIRIAETKEKLAAGDYEQSLYFDSYVSDSAGNLVGENSASEQEVPLIPSGQMISKFGATILVQSSHASKIPGAISPGKHAAQVKVAVKVRKGKKQFLWIAVWSQPFEIDIPQAPKVEHCSGIEMSPRP
jgi:hypothetical protein